MIKLLNYSGNEHFAAKKIGDELTLQGLLHSDLHLQAEGELKSTLGRKIIEPFKKLLVEHSAEEVRRLVDQYGFDYSAHPWGIQNPPIAKFECGDWRLTGWLGPPLASDGFGRVIGPGRSDLTNSAERIRTSLLRKAKHWRKIKEATGREQSGSTYLIAINVCGGNFHDEREASEAIFGSPTPPRGGVGEFWRGLSDTNGIIVVTNGTLGNERAAAVCLYRDAAADVPNCLGSLRDTHRLGDLLGIDR